MYNEKFTEAYSNIQFELKAPKGQYNSFAKYNYRSCEDILEAVKPILHKYKANLNLSDEVVVIGDRFYVKATATLMVEGQSISTCAYAREPEDKKGLDGSQITGTASSYARKYALNGLFCIDDTKDADTDEYAKQNQKTAPAPAKQTFDSTHPQWQRILDAMAQGRGSIAELQKLYTIPPHAEEAIKAYINNSKK